MNSAAAPGTFSPHILLVDDNPHGLVARKQLLSDLGYRVTTVLSAEEALVCLENGTFAMVVTDYKMGRMDGVQLITRLRAANSGVKTILLSGYVDILGMTEESTGADAVLNKDAAELPNLLRAVKRLLRAEEPVRRKPPSSQRRTAAARHA